MSKRAGWTIQPWLQGRGTGIGRAIAVRLAAEGAHVLVGDIDEAAASETTAAINDAVGPPLPGRSM